jgi:hypothetical protein
MVFGFQGLTRYSGWSDRWGVLDTLALPVLILGGVACVVSGFLGSRPLWRKLLAACLGAALFAALWVAGFFLCSFLFGIPVH